MRLHYAYAAKLVAGIKLLNQIFPQLVPLHCINKRNTNG